MLFGLLIINFDVLLFIYDIFMRLNLIVYGGKVVVVFGLYGWSGEVVLNIENCLK